MWSLEDVDWSTGLDGSSVLSCVGQRARVQATSARSARSPLKAEPLDVILHVDDVL